MAQKGSKRNLPVVPASYLSDTLLLSLSKQIWQSKVTYGRYGIYDMFARSKVTAAVWGHAGDANLHMQPYLDLSQIGDRQKAFRLMDEYSRLVVSLGGSTSAGH